MISFTNESWDCPTAPLEYYHCNPEFRIFLKCVYPRKVPKITTYDAGDTLECVSAFKMWCHTTGVSHTDPEIVVRVTTQTCTLKHTHKYTCTHTNRHKRYTDIFKAVLISGWLCMCMSICYTWGLKRLRKHFSTR